jgi:hypothetical protein
MRVSREAIFRQAYADKFTNAEIRPAGPKTPDFNTKPYQPQYVWLGAGARAELVRVSRRLPKRQEQQGQRLAGHFSRFQHNKVFIKVRRGLGAEVFTGKGSHRRA